VPAPILRLEDEVDGDLLARLEPDRDRLARPVGHGPALVEGQLGVEEVAMVLEEPLHPDAVAIEDLLVGLEREDDVTIGPVEPAVLLDERERVGGPVLAPRIDDVEVRDEEDGTARTCPVVPRHEVSLSRRRSEDMNVALRKPRGKGHGLRGGEREPMVTCA
jgi:hypothetical protein